MTEKGRNQFRSWDTYCLPTVKNRKNLEKEVSPDPEARKKYAKTKKEMKVLVSYRLSLLSS